MAVWRELRRSGALHLQQSVVAVPDEEPFRYAIESLRRLVDELGGETMTIRGEPHGGPDSRLLTEAWNSARDAEYGELVSVCEKYLREIEHEFEIEKFTLAELEEEESEFEKLKAWHERIAARDVHGAAGANAANAAIAEAGRAFARYSDAVFERTEQGE